MKQKLHQSTQLFPLSTSTDSKLNFCQRRLYKEAESLRRQTELINKQIEQKEQQFDNKHGQLKGDIRAESRTYVRPIKKNRVSHSLIEHRLQPSLFDNNHHSSNTFKFLLSSIKKVISGYKTSVSDELVEMMVARKQRVNGLNGTNMIQYIGVLASKLEAVVDEQDKLLQRLKRRVNKQRYIYKTHQHDLLIRYAIVFIIELIRLAETNQYLVANKFIGISKVYMVRNMLVHCYPRAISQNSVFSIAEIVQIHNRWARQFVKLKALSACFQDLQLDMLPITYKLIIPTENACALEKRLWEFYLKCNKGNMHQRPSSYYRIESFKNYIRSILLTRAFAKINDMQTNTRKLGWCLTIADIGEIVLQCHNSGRKKFPKTVAIRNRIAHSCFNAVSLTDICKAIDEINSIMFLKS